MQPHHRRVGSLGLSGVLLLLVTVPAGCASNTSVIPASLKTQVDEHLTFSQIKESPDGYHGRVVILGGEVLSAKRLKDGTRIEVLQLPLADQEPVWDRSKSQGRFLAIHKEFLDPATLPKGTHVTIVGEVTGSVTMPLDETEYTYPVLEVKNLTVWPDRTSLRSIPPNFYYGPYWGPYWGPYGWRGYWYGPPYWW